MNIKELKNSIDKNTLESYGMIWKLSDNSSNIIVNQYLDKIRKNTNFNLVGIDSIDEIPDQSFCNDNNLYIIRTDNYDGNLPKYNCIVLCNKTKNKDAIEIPGLESWQVVDYLSAKAPGIKKEDLEWLSTQYNDYNGGYFRMISDIDKISIFPQENQGNMFNYFVNEGLFKDITSLNIWDLTNAVIRNDKKLVNEVLKVIDFVDITPMYFLTTIYNGFRNVINVQLNPNATADELGLSGKQFFVIKKYNCGHYSNSKLIKIFKLITNMEYLFKFGGIDTNQIINYLIVNIMED